MLLILIPYLAFMELNQVLGEGRLSQILFEYRAGSRSGSVTSTSRISWFQVAGPYRQNF